MLKLIKQLTESSVSDDEYNHFDTILLQVLYLVPRNHFNFWFGPSKSINTLVFIWLKYAEELSVELNHQDLMLILTTLNDYLERNSFLCLSRVTIADFVIYWYLQNKYATFIDNGQLFFPCVCRWYTLIEYYANNWTQMKTQLTYFPQ
jgi:glutathione S-transferase